MPELRKAARHESIDEREINQGIQHLLDEGEVAIFRNGNRTRYSSKGVQTLTAADLLDFAEGKITATKGTAGRRVTSDSSREVWEISKPNFTKMKTALYAVARMFEPEVGQSSTKLRKALQEHVTDAFFTWDPDGGNDGGGEWTTLLSAVSRATDKNADSIGAAKKLLDLAATHGFIPRTVRHEPGFQPVRADWAKVYNRWKGRVRSKGRVSHAIIELLRACDRLGLDPTGDIQSHQWAAVIEHLERHFDGAGIDSRTRSAIRGTYRQLEAAGEIDGPHWDGRKRMRDAGLRLLAASTIRAIAEAYGSDRDQPGVKALLSAKRLKADVRDHFPWPGCEKYTGLIEGPLGLRAALTCFVVPEDRLKPLGIPARSVYPRSPIRGGSNRSSAAWRVATCEINLSEVLYYAGWLEREAGVDFGAPGADLRVLLNEGHLQRFYKAVVDEGLSTKGTLRRIAIRLARFASPFAESVALRMGDEPLADQFARVSALLNSRKAVDGYPAWTQVLRQKGNDVISRARKTAREVEEAWTGGRQVAKYAHEQMRRVLDAQVVRLEKESGLRLEAQVQGLATGDFRPGLGWALDVQAALMWADQIHVPLRPATMWKLDASERIHDRGFTWIRARIPGVKMKRGGQDDFSPNYRRAKDSPYPAPLYQLHVLAGGARELLRTNTSGRHQPVPAFYVPNVRTTEETRLSSPQLTRVLRRGLRNALEHVPTCLRGVTYDEVKPQCTPHKFRHAFGTRMVSAGLLIPAAEYLHHTSLEMLRRVYSAQSEKDFDPSADLARLTSTGGQPVWDDFLQEGGVSGI